ncbi:hypothetical protein L596_020255 [Steinernema carpocapsae]|uniref:TIL domain-containing protein n=1 Tax=Steinernema carpocapsae TaxID=34508 RepID=A0A4U5MSZ5_STECR|nr:hypothetical protein L596_020255 [Steinernema carpocapsae]
MGLGACEGTCNNPPPECDWISTLFHLIPGCRCRADKGLVRLGGLDPRNPCIKVKECPKKETPPPECPPNTVFRKCGSCEGTCFNPNPVCTQECRPPGCYCPADQGYFNVVLMSVGQNAENVKLIARIREWLVMKSAGGSANVFQAMSVTGTTTASLRIDAQNILIVTSIFLSNSKPIFQAKEPGVPKTGRASGAPNRVPQTTDTALKWFVFSRPNLGIRFQLSSAQLILNPSVEISFYHIYRLTNLSG